MTGAGNVAPRKINRMASDNNGSSVSDANFSSVCRSAGSMLHFSILAFSSVHDLLWFHGVRVSSEDRERLPFSLSLWNDEILEALADLSESLYCIFGQCFDNVLELLHSSLELARWRIWVRRLGATITHSRDIGWPTFIIPSPIHHPCSFSNDLHFMSEPLVPISIRGVLFGG
jgi:hypothetical protein